MQRNLRFGRRIIDGPRERTRRRCVTLRIAGAWTMGVLVIRERGRGLKVFGGGRLESGLAREAN